MLNWGCESDRIARQKIQVAIFLFQPQNFKLGLPQNLFLKNLWDYNAYKQPPKNLQPLQKQHSREYLYETSLKTDHVYSTLKLRENGCFHVVSTWDTRGVFVWFRIIYRNWLRTTAQFWFFSLISFCRKMAGKNISFRISQRTSLEAYLRSLQASIMELFVEIVNRF